MFKKPLLIISLLAFVSCNDQGGLQKKLGDALGLKKSKSTNGTELKPSKEDQSALANSITSCPKDAKISGKAFPRGNLQYCAYKDEKGKEIKHGEFRSWHPSGKLESQGTYSDGEKEGKVVTFYDNGQIKNQATYLHGQINGSLTEFTKEGEKYALISYHNGIKEGLYAKYAKGGKVNEKGQYQNDMKNGLWEFYGKDGVIKEKNEFKNDIRHGRSIKYNRTGAPLSQGFYSNNEEIGHWIYFNNQGAKKSEGNYVDGKKHGRWVDYDSQGQETRNIIYDYGKKVDTYKSSNNEKTNGGVKGFGKGDIFGSEPPRERPNIYQRPKQEENKPGPLEKEGWDPL